MNPLEQILEAFMERVRQVVREELAARAAPPPTELVSVGTFADEHEICDATVRAMIRDGPSRPHGSVSVRSAFVATQRSASRRSAGRTPASRRQPLSRIGSLRGANEPRSTGVQNVRA